MKRVLLLIVSHLAAIAFGFGLGVFLLPIITAEAAGTISVSADSISHQGKLAPGPDYFVYLTKDLVEHEDEFEPVKAEAMRIGPVKSFDGFLLDIPEGVNVEEYSAIVIWCETFGEFITAAKYR